MEINEIKAGMLLKSSHSGIIVIVSNGEKIDNLFKGFDIHGNIYHESLVSDYFHEISFHEAFQNDVNKIVLDAVTSQNRDSLWNHNNKECLAVSDFQKDWILKNYVLKGENVYAESYVKGIEKNLTELTQKSIDDQRVNDQRFCELYDSKKAISDKFQEATAYIGELKKFIQHLQDYIASKYLENEGLILEKFIQEESDNGRKEST